jgi:hypothetical protein
MQWKLPRNDLCRDQGDLGSQVCGQACRSAQSFYRSFFRGGDYIQSQSRSGSIGCD